MARITILTVGSRGDVQPYCAIAQSLISKGHDVTLAASYNFESFASGLNIPFAPIAGNFKQLLGSKTGIELLEGDTSVQLIDDKLLRQQLEDGWRACQGSDLIVYAVLAIWGYHFAEALGIPAVLTTQFPVVKTRAFPFLNFVNRTEKALPGLANLLSYRLFGVLSWRRRAKLINQFRQEVLNLPPLPYLGASFRRNPPPLLSPPPIVNCFSPTVVPPPPDWKDSIRQAGYCFLETAQSFTPPPELQSFLEQSPKPFYVGFGSMIARDRQRLINAVISAFEMAKQRAILCSGWGEMTQDDLPDNIYLLKSVPHDWLFPRVAAAIHHGGAGTTAATLNAGIPSIVVPFFADQPVWGARLEQLGVSPATLPQLDLTSEQLAENILRVVEEDTFRDCAKELQKKIQEEDGLARTVSMIESYLSV